MTRRLALVCLLPTLLLTAVPVQAAGRDPLALAVPYRSQLDGNPWELADCGPAAMAMVLGAFGKSVPTMEIREVVNDLQGTWYDTNAGTMIENLAVVGGRYGLRPESLFKADGKAFRTWTLAEVRRELDAGRPVIPQVWYRGLPGRERKPYNGDHYIVITGYDGEDFIYNDPIDKDGVGADRRISARRLDLAWRNSDFPYAAVAFAGPSDRPTATPGNAPSPTSGGTPMPPAFARSGGTKVL